MTYQQAEKMLKDNEHLINKIVKGQTIEYLLIAPLNHDFLGELMINHERGKSSWHILGRFTDFDVVAIFHGRQLGHHFVQDKKSLPVILQKLKDQE